MTDIATLDQAFYTIMRSFINTGQAPHYTELAKTLGLSMEEGRQVLHDLVNSGLHSSWLHPDTDDLVSFPPFHNLPNQYRITVDGEQKWFAQWGFESLAVRWLFPNKTVRVDAPCLDCGEPVVVEMRDEQVLSVQPEEMVGYARSKIGGTVEGRPWRWTGMNLFRSEEHARNWTRYDPAFEENLQPLAYWLERFSAERHRARGRQDFISWMKAQQG